MKFIAALLCSLVLLTACTSSPYPAPHQPLKSNEQIKTRATLFMYFNTIPDDLKTAYITVQNNSGTDAFALYPYLVAALKENGFTIVYRLSQANFVLRANQLRVGIFPNYLTNELMQTDFGNSTQPLRLPTETLTTPANYAILVDMQAFQRTHFIDPSQAPKTDASDTVELILLNNIATWEHSQTRIIAIGLHITETQAIILNELGREISTATRNVIRN